MAGRRVIRLAFQLRWALLRGAVRPGPGSGGRRIGLLIGAVVGTFLSVVGFLALTSLHGRPLADDVAVLLFSALLLGWTVLPVLTFSSDDLLDASKLALLPLSTRQVLELHGFGALLGIAPIATSVLCLGLVPATGSSLSSSLVALVAVPLELALCIVLSRTTATALSRLLRSRRGRDLGVALTALVAVSGQLVNPVLQRVGRSDGAEQGLHQVADVLAVLPPGLIASAPRYAREGNLLLAVLHLLIGAASVGVLLLLWAQALRRSEETVDATTRSSRKTTGLTPRLLTWLLPHGRMGAVASKDLRYLTRDPRRLIQLVTGTVFPAFFVVVTPSLSRGGGLSPKLVFAVAGVALFSGLAGSNRFGHDGTSTWMLVASGSDRQTARRDLLGGDLAVLLVVGPLMLLAGAAIAVVCDGWQYLAAAEGLGFAVLGITVGTAGLVAVLAPFPLPEGSRNAFSNGGGGQGLFAAVLVLGLMAVVTIASLPLLLLLVPHVHTASMLVVGPVYGVVVGGFGREIAARLWVSRGPDVLLKLSSAPA
jgi:ABC-2 type transport system permease protein